MNARDFQTGAAMLELVASTAGLTLRDFMTGAYVGKLEAAMDVTPRDVFTGAAVSKLAGGGASGSPLDAAGFLNAAIDSDGWLRSLGGTTDINNDGEPETWVSLAGMTIPVPASGTLQGQIIIPDTIQPADSGVKWLRVYAAESLFLSDGSWPAPSTCYALGLPNPGTLTFTLNNSELAFHFDTLNDTVSYSVSAASKLCIAFEQFTTDDAVRVILTEQAK